MRYVNSKQPFAKLFAHIEGAYAPNTLRAYKADAEEFCDYCTRHRKKAFPADPKTIAEFLLASSETGVKAATIRRKMASISAIHRLSNFSDPTKHSEVKLAIRKIHRKLGTKFKQAYPITENILKKLLKVCGKDLIGKRNRALLLLAYDSMSRRSELVSYRVEDIEYSDTGLMSLLLRRSKTDQHGSGRWIHLSNKTTAAISDWLLTADIGSGHILRGINVVGDLQADLSPGQVGRIFKSLAKIAGLNAQQVGSISGHSIRVGGAQDLLIKGVSLAQIMAKGGWAKTDTVMRYVERVRHIA